MGEHVTAPNKPPDLYEIIKIWVYEHYGVVGLIVLAIIGAAIYAYTNWDKVSRWPGVQWLIARLSRAPIPKADPNRFSVMVAHLEHDVNHHHEKLTLAALNEYEGIQLLPLDRTIVLGSFSEETTKRGHETARRYLEQSGASVLICEMVLGEGATSIPYLHWTDSKGEKRAPKRYDAPRMEEQLRLPAVFWTDLKDILRLLVASRDAEFRAEEGHYTADLLPPFIARVRTLLAASAGRPEWHADARASTRVILANALTDFGDQRGESRPIEEAVGVYREALMEYIRERVPLDWAMTQNNLGLALATLGGRESSVEHLQDAVAAYREALKELTRERVALSWATTQNNLGNAFLPSGSGRAVQNVWNKL